VKRLELIKTAIAIEDEEIIELQVMKIEQIEIDDDVVSILDMLEDSNFAEALNAIENYLQRFSGITIFEDKEMAGLRLELKSLEGKLQNLSAKHNEYLNDISEFSIEYQLALGSILEEILKVSQQIALQEYMKVIDALDEEQEFYEKQKREYEALKRKEKELESKLEDIWEFDDAYDAIYTEYEETREACSVAGARANASRKQTKEKKEKLDDSSQKREYTEANEEYEEFRGEYKETKAKEKNRYELNYKDKKELKTLFRKASKLCHPDIVSQDFIEIATQTMQNLNEAYANKDIGQVKKILNSLENGTIFELASDKIDKKELLFAKIEETRQKIKKVKKELKIVKENEIIIILQTITDLKSYFEEMKEELEEELERLTDIVNGVDEKSKREEKWDIPF